MKRKFATHREIKKIDELKREFSFGTQSFFAAVRAPQRSLVFVFQKDLTSVTSKGTMTVLRTDDDPLPLNVDEYSLYNYQLEGPIKSTGYHWTKDIPEHIQKSAPEWTKEIIQKSLLF